LFIQLLKKYQFFFESVKLFEQFVLLSEFQLELVLQVE